MNALARDFLRVFGDVEGHEFHGNQWTTGQGVRDWAESVKKKLPLDLVNFMVSRSKTGLNLELMTVDKRAHGKGIGTQAMQELVKFADTHQLPIKLSAERA